MRQVCPTPCASFLLSRKTHPSVWKIGQWSWWGQASTRGWKPCYRSQLWEEGGAPTTNTVQWLQEIHLRQLLRSHSSWHGLVEMFRYCVSIKMGKCMWKWWVCNENLDIWYWFTSNEQLVSVKLLLFPIVSTSWECMWLQNRACCVLQHGSFLWLSFVFSFMFSFSWGNKGTFLKKKRKK